MNCRSMISLWHSFSSSILFISLYFLSSPGDDSYWLLIMSPLYWCEFLPFDCLASIDHLMASYSLNTICGWLTDFFLGLFWCTFAFRDMPKPFYCFLPIEMPRSFMYFLLRQMNRSYSPYACSMPTDFLRSVMFVLAPLMAVLTTVCLFEVCRLEPHLFFFELA